MSDKALTNAELELTQRMQMHFPRGVIPPKMLAFWNSCPKEVLTQKMVEVCGQVPDELGNIFPLTLNYDLPLAEAIAAGRYGVVNSDITPEHFPNIRTGTAELEAQLVHFNHPIDSDDVLKELDKIGLRAGELPELLAFGAKYPEKQREFPIISLGSVWRDRDDFRRVPGLWGHSDSRNLGFYWYAGGWYEDCRFLAFHK
ncbi:MAG: hypothetical protein AAB725_01805 [Patescibacteria group bacterium]